MIAAAVFIAVCLSGSNTMALNDSADLGVIQNAVENLTMSDLSPEATEDDGASWVPPGEITKRLPYYISGYDYEHRPVMVCEFGNWDIRSFFDKSEMDQLVLYKYAKKFFSTFKTLKSPFKNAAEGVTYILDVKGFNLSQLTSLEVIKYHLWSARETELLESTLADVLIINVGFPAEVWINIIRPVSPGWLAKAETISQNKNVLFAKLNQKVSKDQLPPWYGGTKTEFPTM